LTLTVKVTMISGRSLCGVITLLLLSAGQASPGRLPFQPDVGLPFGERSLPWQCARQETAISLNNLVLLLWGTSQFGEAEIEAALAAVWREIGLELEPKVGDQPVAGLASDPTADVRRSWSLRSRPA